MMSRRSGIRRSLFIVLSAHRVRDGMNEVVCLAEVGSCSLQEQEVLGHSVKALIGRRNRDRKRLTQLPLIRFTTPQ